MAEPVFPTYETVRETTRAIIERPEFTRRPAAENWFADFLRWLDTLTDKLNAWAADHPVGRWVLIFFLVLILVALLAHILHVALGEYSPWHRPEPTRPTAAPWTVLEGLADSWKTALAQAEQALNEGNERLAVWIGHRVLLGLLDGSGAIRFAAGKTNADYLAECDAAHPWQPTLVQLTEIYNRVVYGHRLAGKPVLGPILRQVASLAQN